MLYDPGLASSQFPLTPLVPCSCLQILNVDAPLFRPFLWDLYGTTPTLPSASSRRYDLQTLSLDFLELLTRFLPTEYERSLIARFEKEQRPMEELSEEDRFMLRFSRIQRLPERMNTLTFLGNFPDTAQLLMPVWAGRAGWCGGAGAGGRQAVWLQLTSASSHP